MVQQETTFEVHCQKLAIGRLLIKYTESQLSMLVNYKIVRMLE
jgi:hypothetical protein